MRGQASRGAHGGRWLPPLSSVATAAILAMATLGTAPPIAAAVAPSAFMLDTLQGGLGHTVRTYHAPGDSTINVSWTGSELFIDASFDGGFQQYSLRTGTDQPFSVGTFPIADVNGCVGSVTIHALEPALQVSVSVEPTTLSASFTRACGTESTFGELRYHNDDPYTAIGDATLSYAGWTLSMSGADESFVGRMTGPTSIVLKNYGTTTLTFGATTQISTTDAKWTFTTNTCTGTLAPDATCTITGTAVAWIPGGYEDDLNLTVSTTRGSLRLRAPSAFAAARFVPIDPVRLVDTRIGLGVSSSLKSGVARTFSVIDRAPGNPAVNIPPEAVAVSGSLLVTAATTSGSAALTTTASNSPSIRTLYLPAGDTRSNGVITRLSEAGTLGLTWVGGAGSSAQAIFDATGYFVPVHSPTPLREGNWRPWTPTRVVNTTKGQGIATKLIAGQPRTFDMPLAGVDWGSTAVGGVLTVLDPTKNGFLYLGPTPVAAPAVSMLHFRSGDSRTNMVVAKLSTSPGPATPKKLSITYVGPAGSAVDVVFEVFGTFGSGQAGYVPLLPSRIVDTAAKKGLTKALVARTLRPFNVANRALGDPSRNIPPDRSIDAILFKGGIVGNLWMMAPTATGAAAASPESAPNPPAAFAIRARAGDRRASGVIAGLSNSMLLFYYSAPTGATTHVIFDVSGYFVLL